MVVLGKFMVPDFLSFATFLSMQRVLIRSWICWIFSLFFIHLHDPLGLLLVWKTSITRTPDQQNSGLEKQISQVLTDADRTIVKSWLPVSALFK